ncbi:ATP synthase F1 subunit gamma [bacterium]|nr:MAG: ATP synthase F1 subunit gamma [bacterium]
MAGLKIIKRRISSVKSTQQVTKVMKMVAAAKLRRAQEDILRARPYALELRRVIHELSGRIDRSTHPLLALRAPEQVAIVVVTGDRGLAGGFNANILKKSRELIEQHKTSDVRLITVGKKGTEFFDRRGANITARKINFFNQMTFADAVDLGDKVISRYVAEVNIDRVLLVYNEFKSVLQQQVVVEQLLPIEPTEEEMAAAASDLIYEPSEMEILDSVLPRFVKIQLWRVLLESYSAEMAARMTAMENATKNASELIDSLTLSYNNARQAAITGEILEIVAGAEGLK